MLKFDSFSFFFRYTFINLIINKSIKLLIVCYINIVLLYNNGNYNFNDKIYIYVYIILISIFFYCNYTYT